MVISQPRNRQNARVMRGNRGTVVRNRSIIVRANTARRSKSRRDMVIGNLTCVREQRALLQTVTKSPRVRFLNYGGAHCNTCLLRVELSDFFYKFSRWKRESCPRFHRRNSSPPFSRGRRAPASRWILSVSQSPGQPSARKEWPPPLLALRGCNRMPTVPRCPLSCMLSGTHPCP